MEQGLFRGAGIGNHHCHAAWARRHQIRRGGSILGSTGWKLLDSAEEKRLRLDFMPFEERSVGVYGILVDQIAYYHDVLRRWINAKDGQTRRKRRFIVRRDPRDISVIYFFDPELKDYFTIPYRDTSHSAALTVWELRKIRRDLKERGKKQAEEADIFRAYEEMRRIEEDSSNKTKEMRRNVQRRQVAAARPQEVSNSNKSLTKAGLWEEAVTAFDDLALLK
jgi:putative transposase